MWLLMQCKKCTIQQVHVGETENALHLQFTGYQLDINHERSDKPVASHFNLSIHSLMDLSIMVIEKIYREDTRFRKRKATGYKTSNH